MWYPRIYLCFTALLCGILIDTDRMRTEYAWKLLRGIVSLGGDRHTASKMWYSRLFCFTASLLARHYQPHVQLRGTSIIGKHVPSYNQDFFGGTSFFLSALTHQSLISLSGIPFAEPPVASLRFAPPQLKLSLAPLQSFDARSYGPSCLQLESSRYSPTYSLSEPNTI